MIWLLPLALGFLSGLLYPTRLALGVCAAMPLAFGIVGYVSDLGGSDDYDMVGFTLLFGTVLAVVVVGFWYAGLGVRKLAELGSRTVRNRSGSTPLTNRK